MRQTYYLTLAYEICGCSGGYDISGNLLTWNNRNRQVVANIAGYYAKKVGINDVGTTYKKGGMAHYRSSDNSIWITPSNNGNVATLLNDKYNLMNTLIHEQKHRDDKANDITSTYESHVGGYFIKWLMNHLK